MTTDIGGVRALSKDRESFERALEALRAANFRNSDISAILPDRDHTTKDLAHEINTKTPEGIAAGASAGAAVGGVLGWLVGIGALAIPGIGPLVAAGPMVAALAGAGAAGADRRSGRRPHRRGHSRGGGQALRRTDPRGRVPAVGALRRQQVGEEGRGDPRADRRQGRGEDRGSRRRTTGPDRLWCR